MNNFTYSSTIINPPEINRSYSSGGAGVNSFIDSSSYWHSAGHDTSQYIMMDLNTIQSVLGAITQGRGDYDDWITSYKVSFSIDNITYLYITTTGTTTNIANAQIFIGNRDRNTKVENIFNSIIQARYVRYHPVTWYRLIVMMV